MPNPFDDILPSKPASGGNPFDDIISAPAAKGAATVEAPSFLSEFGNRATTLGKNVVAAGKPRGILDYLIGGPNWRMLGAVSQPVSDLASAAFPEVQYPTRVNSPSDVPKTNVPTEVAKMAARDAISFLRPDVQVYGAALGPAAEAASAIPIGGGRVLGEILNADMGAAIKQALVRRGIISPEIVVPKGYQSPRGTFSEGPIVEQPAEALPAPTKALTYEPKPPVATEPIRMPAPPNPFDDVIRMPGPAKNPFNDIIPTVEPKPVVPETIPQTEQIKPEIVTDASEVQKIRNSIDEGKLILKTGKFHDRKFSPDELEAVRRSVNNSLAKIGEAPIPEAPVAKSVQEGVPDRTVTKSPRVADLEKAAKKQKNQAYFVVENMGKQGIFHYEGDAFSVDAAEDYVKANNVKPIVVPVDLYSQDKVNAISSVGTLEKGRPVDLDIPGIVLTSKRSDGTTGYRLIDGWNRAQKALNLGKDLLAYPVPKEVSDLKEIWNRVHGKSKPQPPTAAKEVADLQRQKVAESKPVRTQATIDDMPAAQMPKTGLRSSVGQKEDLLAGFEAPKEQQPGLFGQENPMQDVRASNIARLRTELAKYKSLPDTPENRQRIHLIESRLAIAEGGELYQEVAPTFFSKLERTIEQKMPNASTSEQVMGILRGSGVKAEEMAWLDMEGFLKGKARVTKQEVLDHIRENNVQVEEVVKGSAPELTESERHMLDYLEQNLLKLNEKESEMLGKLRAKAGRGQRGEGGTKFSQWQLPSGENYRELLLKMPTADSPRVNALRQQLEDIVSLPATQQTVGGESRTAAYDRVYKEFVAAGGKPRATEFKSGHFDEPNVLAHVRFNDRLTFDAPGPESLVQSKLQKVGADSLATDAKLLSDGVKSQAFLTKGISGLDVEARQSMLSSVVSAVGDSEIRRGVIPLVPVEVMDNLVRAKLTPDQFFSNKAMLTDSLSGNPNATVKLSPDSVSRLVRTVADLTAKRVPNAGKLPGVSIQSGSAPSAKGSHRGYRTLFIEEIQSDWAQGLRAGKEYPDMPFKKTWHELALKRILRYAAENGYDRVAWTTGEQQAARYDLSKHIDKVTAQRNTKGNYNLYLTRKGATQADQALEQTDVAADKLSEVIGKELAQKVIEHQAAPGKSYSFSGLDLKVGGEGMKGFYDQMLPSYLNNYAKKWGVMVGQTEVSTGAKIGKDLVVTGDNEVGWQVFTPEELQAAGMPEAEFPTKREALDFIKAQKGNTETVHSLDITPSMKASVMGEGQPLFQIPVAVAKELDMPIQLPNDPVFQQAVANTPGAKITEDGLVIDLVRFQKPEMAGEDSVRTGMFYLPSGSPNTKHYSTGKNWYGGKQRVEGQTLIKHPLFTKGATGGKAVETAYDQIKGKGAYEAMRSDVLQNALTKGWPRQPDENAISAVLEKYGADPDLTYQIVANSREGNQLPYAIQENIVAHAVREAGYDAVIGWSKTRTTAQPFISEVFDVREITYPTPDGDFTIHPKFKSSLKQEGESGLSTFQAEADKVQAILEKHGVQDVVIKLVDAIQTPSGGKAVGSFVPGQGVVKLTPSPMSTTGYHEAFHVLVRRTGVGEGLEEALSEIRQKFGARDSKEAEEILADEFAKYANRKASPKWSDKLKAFFDKIMAHIKRLFGKDSRARRLFDELLNPKKVAGEARPLGGEAFQDVPKKPRNMISMGKARKDAVEAVARDLREQATIFNQDRIDLRRNVLQAGGIKPTLGGGMREELQAIRPFLRQRGLPIDVLATELGFPDGETLRHALAAARSAKIPKMSDLRRQAETIINSEKGNAILEAVQAEGVASKAAQRIIKQATAQMNEAVSEAGKKAASLLEAGNKRQLTPNQIARLSRLYRTEPGAKVQGPKGGKTEAPLSDADIRRATAATEALVPPKGQPTGTPPKIPTNRQLTSTEHKNYPFKDLTELQATAFSGFDPHRTAEWIDGKPFGPTDQNIVQPIRKAEIAKREENIKLIQELRSVSKGIKRKSKESALLADYIEGHAREGVLAGEQRIPDNIKKASQWMRAHYEDLIDRVNEARIAVGKRPILKRKDYMTHLSEDQTLWQQTLGAMSSEPDEKLFGAANKAAEFIRGKAPFFRFGLPRKGGEYAKDAIRAFEVYADTALRVIHMTRPGRVADVFLSNLPPNAQAYFGRYLSKVVHGKLGPLAQMTPRILRQLMVRGKARFAKGTILGNISSIAQQPFTLPATVSATGFKPATQAAAWLMRGDGMSFAESFSDTLRGRMFELDLSERGLRSITENALAVPLEAADRALVAHAFLSGYIDAVNKGSGIEEAVKAGDRIAQRTQSSFLEADLAPIFQDEVTSGFVQFQNTVNGVFNYMFHDLKRSDHALYRALLFLGTFATLVGIYEELGIPHPDSPEDFVPGMSSLREGPAIGRIAKLAMESGSKDKAQAAKSRGELSKMLLSLAFPGANQATKTFRGLKAISRGGVYNKRGRLNFPVAGPAEDVRALVFGPYGTKAGRSYIRRGFKPEKKVSN